MNVVERASMPDIRQAIDADVETYLTQLLKDGQLNRFNTAYAKIRPGDTVAVDHIITTLPEILPKIPALGMFAYLNYLSDISHNELRGGGFNGLQGPDEDVRTVKRSLLGTICAWPTYDQAQDLGTGLTETGYTQVANHLVLRAVGLDTYGQFIASCDQPVGTYNNLDPAMKLSLLRDLALNDLSAFDHAG
jgi:hypothetical protein